MFWNGMILRCHLILQHLNLVNKILKSHKGENFFDKFGLYKMFAKESYSERKKKTIVMKIFA